MMSSRVGLNSVRVRECIRYDARDARCLDLSCLISFSLTQVIFPGSRLVPEHRFDDAQPVVFRRAIKHYCTYATPAGFAMRADKPKHAYLAMSLACLPISPLHRMGRIENSATDPNASVSRCHVDYQRPPPVDPCLHRCTMQCSDRSYHGRQGVPRSVTVTERSPPENHARIML